MFNPAIVTGQQHGAIAMGISGVLLEEIVYDENGQNRSGSFADYMLATAVEIPPIEVISQHTPNRRTLTGSKGMSEGGVMGAIGVGDERRQRRAIAVRRCRRSPAASAGVYPADYAGKVGGCRTIPTQVVINRLTRPC